MTFQCDWFHHLGRRSRGRFLLGIQDGRIKQDLTRYPLTGFVGIVDFEMKHENGRDVFSLLNNGQLKRFKLKAKEMGPAAVSQRELVNLRQRQRDREQGNYYREFVPRSR